MNRVISGVKDWSDFKGPLYNEYYCLLQKIAPGRFTCLEPSCNGMPMETEHRKHAWVKFLITALNSGVDVDTLPDVCSCDVIVPCSFEIPSSSSSSSESSSSSSESSSSSSESSSSSSESSSSSGE